MARQVRLLSSVRQQQPNTTPSPSQQRKEERRKFHSTSRRNQADAVEKESTAVAWQTSELLNRFAVMAEVTVSKIFPAGFGWQLSSIVAENNFGFSPESMNFALTTGMGDAIG